MRCWRAALISGARSATTWERLGALATAGVHGLCDVTGLTALLVGGEGSSVCGKGIHSEECRGCQTRTTVTVASSSTATLRLCGHCSFSVILFSFDSLEGKILNPASSKVPSRCVGAFCVLRALSGRVDLRSLALSGLRLSPDLAPVERCHRASIRLGVHPTGAVGESAQFDNLWKVGGGPGGAAASW